MSALARATSRLRAAGASCFLGVLFCGSIAGARPASAPQLPDDGALQDAGNPNADHAERDEQASAPRDVDRLGWYVPDFAKLQTGGLRGRITGGLGYAAFDDILNVGLLYGFSPHEVQDTHLSTFSFEVAVRPLELAVGQFRIQPIEVGVGLLYAVGDEFELRYPDRYSSGYYKPAAIHALCYLGVGLDWIPRGSKFERVGVYYQVATIYAYLADVLANPRQASMFDSLASTIGYRAAF